MSLSKKLQICQLRTEVSLPALALRLLHLSTCQCGIHDAFQPLSMPTSCLQSFSSKCVACTCLRRVSSQHPQQSTNICCVMLLRRAQMLTHLETHILPPMLQLTLTVNVYGKLLTAATYSPVAQNIAADGSCMQTPPQTAIQITCHKKWLTQCQCAAGIQHRRHSWATPEPAGQGARSS